ncbi:hypothetical protein JTB14_024684 [Gonioctena quinquepunctata]|nr:hypothetical protein JTB14_024684 [Gonioctena quinquepunctata]
MSLLCEDMDDSYKQGLFPNKTFTEDFYDQIDYLRPTAESTFFFCTFMDESEECSDLFVPIVLDDGICYTFNILDRQEIYKDDVMHYNNHHRNKNVSSWTIDGGYAKGSGRKTYPRRALLAGADNALQVFLMQNVIDKDQLCTRDSQGYTVVFHTPHIIPQLRRNYIMIPLDTSVQVNVQPQLMTTSKEVKGYRPVVRQCYFTDERPLKFFRIYNPENCNLECLTNYTLNKCGCVGFYMPRNNNTAICGNGMTECMERAIYEMKERELEMFLEDSQEKDATCNCMPLCNELTYQTETARLYFPWRGKFTAEKHFSTLLDYKGVNISEIHMSAVSIFFKQDYFQTSQRTELYGPFDFLANFGGLLGLFTGFSLLSAVEIIYYISVRLWCNKRLYNDFSGPQNEA